MRWMKRPDIRVALGALGGLLLLLQPASAFIWDIIIFHREINVVSAAGAAITLCAIYVGVAVDRQD